MTLPIAFIAMLRKSAQPIEQKLYKCAGCYRESLKPEQISVVSRGEAYCKTCTGG